MCKWLACTRSINGTANAITTAYDAMSRVTGITNPLGAFGYTYVDENTGSDKGTTRLAQMTYPNGQVTNYSYFGSTGDERLEQISNLTPSSANLSQSNYTYDSKGQITSWKQQTDGNAATRLDTAYDPAGQLISAVRKTDATNAVLKQYYYNYDAAANRTSEQVDGSVTQTGVNSVNQITGQTAGGATRFQGTISEPGTVKVNGQPATMPTSTNFVANPTLNSGTNTVAVVATDGSGNAQTNNYQVVVPAGTAVTPSYDADGNMVNNGNGQTYQWDAENRLVEITQGSNTYQFAYDGLGRRVSETDNGTLAKQWVWVGSTMAEERDASGTVTKRFYDQGEQITGQQTAVLSGYGASYGYTFTVGFGLNNGLPSGTAAITLISPDLIVAPTTDLSSINQYPLGDFSRSLSLIFMENPIGDQGSGPLAEGSVTSYTVTYEAAPEPSACALASLGLMAVFFARRFTGRVYPPNR